MSAVARIELDPEAYEYLMGTRVPYCPATRCRYNAINKRDPNGRLECLLKRIYLDEQGRCRFYDPETECVSD